MPGQHSVDFQQALVPVKTT